MKKSVKIFVIFLVVCLIFLIAGGVMLGFGQLKKVDEIVESFNIAIGETTEVDESDSVNAENINEIEICDVGCKVIIKPANAGEDISVSLKGTAIGTKKPRLELEYDDNELKIGIESVIDEVGFNILGINPTDDLTLKILIPTDYENVISFSDMAGEVECSLESFELKGVEFEDCAGNVTVNVSDNCSTFLKIDNTAGEFEAKGSFNNVEVSDTVGKSEITVTDGFEKISVSDTVGEVTIYIPADTKGTIDVRKSLGEFITDFDVEKSNEFSYSGTMNDGGSSKFISNDTIGNINLKKIA